MEFSQDNHSLSSAESSVTQESLKRKSDTSVMSGQEAPTKKLKLTNDSSQASERDISSQSTIAGDHFSATRGHEFSDGPSTPLGNPARASYSTQANPEIKGGGMFMVFSTDLTHSMTSDCISPISRSSTPAPTSIQRRRKVGRPRTKALLTGPSTKRFKKSTVLRVNRPVEARLPMDIWDRIFEFSKPEALFKLRSVSPGFKEALSKEGVWKDSLFQEFGPSLPDPPQGLSYMHYANLLTSHGCQACNNLCGGKARRTYWAFQRRYCEICLVDKIVFDKALRADHHASSMNLWRYTQRIRQCLPQAKYDSWGHYQWVGDHNVKPVWANTYPSAQKVGYLRSAVKKLEDELQTYLATDPTPEEIDAWFDTKRNINDVLVSQLQAVEDFCEKRRVAKLDVTQQSKRTRREFYQEKAASLNPPIELKVLHNCASYQKAIAISRPPVDLERSWRTLLPKLKAEEGPVKAHIERQDRETQRLRDLHAGTRPHYKGLIGQGLPNYYG